MISRVLQWLWFEATTEVWSPTMAARGLAPSLRWACTGRDADARREAYSPAEAFRAGMREAELEALRFELGEVRATYERSLADARAEVNRLRAEARAERERLRAAPGQPAVGAAPKIDAATWPEAHDGVTEPPLASQISIDLVASLRRAGWTPEVTWLDPGAGDRWSEADEYDLAHLREVASGAAGRNASAQPPAADRPPLAAGQRWRERGGGELTMQPRSSTNISGLDLDAVCAHGIAVPYRTGAAAPDGWTFLGGPGEPAPSQLRIERRADGEYLVGASGMPNDCEEVSPDGERLCTRHLDDQHLSCSGCAEEGPLKIDARWPIAAEPGEPEADPRWREGAVWEHRADVVRRLELRQVEGELAALRVQGTWGAIQTVRRADMTEEKGWRWRG